MPSPPGSALDRRARVPAPRSARQRLVALTRRVGWSVIGLCLATYATSLAVPLWYEVHDQRLLIVASGSMSPYFEAGDAVVMRAITDPSQLRVGQVASFLPPGSQRLVTHRIVELRMLPVLRQNASTGHMVPTIDPATGAPAQRPYILTKGDANRKPDPDATPVSRVRGVVLTVHARWGAVLAWVGSSGGRFVLLTPPLGILAAMEIASMVQARRARAAAPGPDQRRSAVDDFLWS